MTCEANQICTDTTIEDLSCTTNPDEFYRVLNLMKSAICNLEERTPFTTDKQNNITITFNLADAANQGRNFAFPAQAADAEFGCVTLTRADFPDMPACHNAVRVNMGRGTQFNPRDNDTNASDYLSFFRAVATGATTHGIGSGAVVEGGAIVSDSPRNYDVIPFDSNGEIKFCMEVFTTPTGTWDDYQLRAFFRVVGYECVNF